MDQEQVSAFATVILRDYLSLEGRGVTDRTGGDPPTIEGELFEVVRIGFSDNATVIHVLDRMMSRESTNREWLSLATALEKKMVDDIDFAKSVGELVEGCLHSVNPSTTANMIKGEIVDQEWANQTPFTNGGHGNSGNCGSAGCGSVGALCGLTGNPTIEPPGQ
jgi:hypothetical protein